MKTRHVRRRQANAYLRRWVKQGEPFDRPYPRIVAYGTGHWYWAGRFVAVRAGDRGA